MTNFKNEEKAMRYRMLSIVCAFLTMVLFNGKCHEAGAGGGKTELEVAQANAEKALAVTVIKTSMAKKVFCFCCVEKVTQVTLQDGTKTNCKKLNVGDQVRVDARGYCKKDDPNPVP